MKRWIRAIDDVPSHRWRPDGPVSLRPWQSRCKKGKTARPQCLPAPLPSSAHCSGTLLAPAKGPNGILQVIHAREPEVRGSLINASMLVGQGRDTLAVT